MKKLSSHQLMSKKLSLNVFKRARSSAATVVEDEHADRHICEPVPSSRSGNFQTVKDYNEIPGPKPFPLIGNSWRFLPFIGQYKLDEVDVVSTKLREQYGDIVKIAGILGRPDMVFLYDADEIEKVFRTEDHLPYRPSMPSLNYYKHVLRKDYFQDSPGLIAVHGEQWWKFRSKIQKPILQPRVIKLYMNDIEETADRLVSRMRKRRNDENRLKKDFLNDIHLWSLESIARVALDIRLGCLDDVIADKDTQDLIDAVNTFFKNVGTLELKIPFWKVFNTPTWKTYINSLDTINNVTMKYVRLAFEKQKKQTTICEHNASLLQRVLAIEPDNPKLATILALDMFLVGIDTTSAAVASILYQLSKNKDKQEKLFREINDILPDDDKLTVEKLDQMQYLKACIKETLRMYPVVIGNGRCITEDTIISGYYVPKGVQVVFQHCVISNSEKYFKNAKQFEPERWLKCNKEHHHHSFASLPFGYGKRMCLGRRFADLEIQTVIAKIIQSFRVDFEEQLEYKVQPMYLPKGALSFIVKDR